MGENYDVVVFFGPPFAGKSAYFKHHLQSSHQRISATELYKENPEFGLRRIILKISSFLKDGKKVVIDDENWTKATRMSYVNTLSSKFPACKFLGLKFKPQGLLTPYWSMEWALAERVLHHDISNVPFDIRRAEAKIIRWFGKNYYEGLELDEIGKEEGLDLKIIETKLTADVQYKFRRSTDQLHQNWWSDDPTFWRELVQPENALPFGDFPEVFKSKIVHVTFDNQQTATQLPVVPIPAKKSDHHSTSFDEADRLIGETVNQNFEVPALFVQWQAITVRTSDDAVECHKDLADVFNCWVKTNPWGRIIIIMDGINDTGGKDSDSCVIPSPDAEVLKPILHRLSKDVTVPIYTFQLQSHTRNFCCPPQVGILAFLQRLHHINLFHRHTLYLHCTQDHAKMASDAGVRHALARNILANHQMVVKPRCATNVTVKPELRDIDLKQSKGQRSLPMVPLFNESKDCIVDEQWGYFEESLPWKYMHGVCFKDSDTFEIYQQLYADTASHISEPGSKMLSHQPTPSMDTPITASAMTSNAPTDQTDTTQGPPPSTKTARVLPSWLLPKSQRQKLPTPDKCVKTAAVVPSLDDSSLEDEVPTERGKKRSSTQHSTVYCMNVLELLETAQLILQESGESVASISNLMTSSSNPKTKKPSNSDSDVLNTTDDGFQEDMQPSPTVTVETNDTHNSYDNEDMFMPSEKVMPGKPPPKKKRQQQQSIKSELMTYSSDEEGTSASVTPELLRNIVPETITTIQETVGFQASTGTGAKDKRTMDKSGPDLSFLDDIF